jgi:hypothetical protein
LLSRSATDAPKASGAALPLAAAGSAPPASTGRAAAEPRPQAANPQPALASTGAAAEPIVRATPPPASDVELTAHHASDSARPLGRRPWFIGTMAGIGAVALGAVVVGVVVGTAAPASVVLDRVDTRTPQ